MKNNQYNIRDLDLAERPLWDDFVRSSANGLLFHSTSWADTIQTVFKRPYKITVLMKNEIIVSGILYWPREGSIPSITSTPLTYYQGILHIIPPQKKLSSVNADIQKRTDMLLNYLCEKYSFIDIPLSRNVIDTRTYKWKNFNVKPFHTYIIELTSDEEILARFNQSLRRKINVSGKQDLSVVASESTKEITQFIADSYKYHRTTPPISSEKIELFLQETIKRDIGRIYYLEKQGEYLCGLAVLWDKNNLFAIFSGINSRYRDSQYSQFLHASVLLLPEFRGKTFDFLGANTRQLEQFKRSFGGELHTFFRVTYYKNPIVKGFHRIRSFQHIFSRKILRFVK